MATAPEPREETWDPSTLFACDALPNHLDDSDSVTSDLKSATNFYDRSLTSRRYALAGVACSSIVSCCCIVAGAVIAAAPASGGAVTLISAGPSGIALRKEMVVISLNLIVTLCTEATGFVHNISLRSVLASESRLNFNSNLRLLTAAHGWSNPNGALLNGIMVVLLVISYSSASLVALPSYSILYDVLSGEAVNTVTATRVDIIGTPLLILGVALLLQVVITLTGMRAIKILTWSSSPFDLTAALIHHAQLTPVLFRCMRGVSDLDVDGGPARPSDTQPSAWHAHPSIRKVIISLWCLVVACAGWGVLILYIHDAYEGYTGQITWKSWSFFPDDTNFLYSLRYQLAGAGGGLVEFEFWILTYVNLAVIQGPLTLCLHCSELIANVIRDEGHWRCATGQGITLVNPLKSVFANPLCLALFVAKPILHWIFGLCFVLLANLDVYSSFGVDITIYMYPMQILNLWIVLFVFACFFTFVARRQRRGPQPAAYGHLQTLANLVDEWTPVMWWGHKEDGIPYCHAGRVLVWS
ncbi:hypothetical protein DEU56DRAFT_800661 [Suillus clintonianus]|uniref:uncharacterized protein n=1 Tax=Suillus clintonianus TaxID=1904413 RepID=UPI001B86B6DA|nr:uncharacterized protein DEU56DRAFT_800661 [Suillus clintonianus]KAG2139314.1 hypothetical protein DEU56DRAFT_800661 [Suillus clintonianus]